MALTSPGRLFACLNNNEQRPNPAGEPNPDGEAADKTQTYYMYVRRDMRFRYTESASLSFG